PGEGRRPRHPPARRARERRAARPEPGPDRELTPPVPGARVLIGEDRVDTSRLLGEVLGAAGFHAASVPHEVLVERALVREGVRVVVASFSGRGVGATAALLRELRSRPEPEL